MTEPENVFRLRSLDTDKPSNYLLSVYFPVPFGMGKNVFQVDTLGYDSIAKQFIATKDGKTAVCFPESFQYLLIGREQYEVISMDEAKKLMAEAEKEEGKELSGSSADDYVPPTRYL